MAIVRMLVKAAGALVLALASLALLAVGALFVLHKAGVPFACGGQCISPYTLQVDFKPTTTIQADSALVRSCARHDPEVVSITPAGLDRNGSGEIESIVQTVDFGGPKAKPLIGCLDASPLVEDAGYPD